MNISIKQTLPKLLVLLSSASIAACGGGGGSSAAANIAASPSATDTSTLLAGSLTAAGTAITPPVKTVAAAPLNPIALLTDATLESTSTVAQTSVPVTFGQVFAKGDVAPNVELTGTLADGTVVNLQVDAKANHADGSLRHAVISAVLPKLAANQSVVVSIKKTATVRSVSTSAPAALLAAGFSAGVSLKLDGKVYTVSASDLLKSGKYTTWLSGPMVNEWQVSAPLKTAAGVEHPHLSARFAIRSYTGLNKARVDVTVENDWAYQPNPSNFTYDATVTVGAQTTYQKVGLTHLHHARWRKLAWWGAAPEVHVKHNQAYLIASRALPNYDQSIQFSDATLAAWKSRYAASNTEPMGLGLSMAYMPTTGGRPDIGLMPGWAATYLLTMDKRAKEVTLGTAELAGSYSMHYRDKDTDRPVSLVDYPYMTIIDPHVGDTLNPATGKTEAFPECNNCATPYTSDVAHQPAYAYLPYLVTGDYFYLEELQFWAMANAFNGHPGYREYAKGLVIAEQTRGQAWALRTLSEAAYITPDSDKFKKQFETILSNNLDWYNNNYTNNPSANSLGVLTDSIGYLDSTALAPWQDDFFTSAIGHASELGFDKASSLLLWKSKFSISRMTGAGTCWLDAAIYNMVVRPDADSAVFKDIGTAYRASHTASFNALACNSPAMAAALGVQVGEMSGASSTTEGIPSTMQPALAFSANVAPVTGGAAWKLFMSRSVKPDYSQGPQFAIVPR